MDILKISRMTGKLDGFKAINTSSMHNAYCEKMAKTNTICGVCYSRKALSSFRANCKKPWKDNGELLSSTILEDWQLPRLVNDKYVRLHAHGELINYKHLVNFANICIVNPDTIFVLWTKRKSFINRLAKSGGGIPDNLILVYSNPIIDSALTMPPKNFDKVFNVVSKPDSTVNCNRKCADCLLCYSPKYSDTLSIIEVIK